MSARTQPSSENERPVPVATAASPQRTAARRVLLAYYLATPLFALLDLAIGINIRVTFFDNVPALKMGYYVLALACGAAVLRWPTRAARIGLAESGANIALLVLGLAVGYLRLMDAAGGDTALPAWPLRGPELLNLLVSACALGLSYFAAQTRPPRVQS